MAVDAVIHCLTLSNTLKHFGSQHSTQQEAAESASLNQMHFLDLNAWKPNHVKKEMVTLY